MYYSKNYWADPEYKGINTRWLTAEGQRFEVQFHTPDSFHAKHDVTTPGLRAAPRHVDEQSRTP